MLAVPAAMTGKPRVVGLLVAKELEILDQLLSVAAAAFRQHSRRGQGFGQNRLHQVPSGARRQDAHRRRDDLHLYERSRAEGIGGSKAEGDKLDVARELLRIGQAKIVLPVDHLVVEKLDAPQTARVVEGDIPDGTIGVDIGPKTIALYNQEIAKAGTVVWNGPLGKFEDEPYSKGTRAIAEALARSRGVTIVGGGETAEAVEHFGLDGKMKHVSTGGGAFLEYVEGTPFAALAQIEEAT